MAVGRLTKEIGALYRMHARENRALENSYGNNDVNLDTSSQIHFLKWVTAKHYMTTSVIILEALTALEEINNNPDIIGYIHLLFTQAIK